jgi:hypothetical protein
MQREALRVKQDGQVAVTDARAYGDTRGLRIEGYVLEP